MSQKRPLTYRIIVALLLCMTVLIGSAPAALADEDPGQKASEEQLKNLKEASPEDREKVRKAAVDEVTNDLCDTTKKDGFRDAVSVPWGTGKGDAQKEGDRICKENVGGQVDKYYDTPEKALTEPGPGLADICGSARDGYSAMGWNAGLKKYCALESAEQFILEMSGVAVGKIMSNPTVAKVIDTAETVGKVAKFVANPKDGFAYLANYLHEEAVTWTQSVLDSVVDSTTFDPSQQWFLDSWAGAAGIGILLLGAMLLLTFKHLAEGKIDRDETINSVFKWAPIAAITAVFGPQIMAQLTGSIHAMSSSIVAGDSDGQGKSIADSVDGFLTAIGTLQAGTGGGGNIGVILGCLLFLFLLVTALALFLTFVFQKFALIFIGYGIALSLGMLGNPIWRPYVVKFGSTWLAVLASQPTLLILLTLVFQMPSSTVEAEGVMGVIAQMVLVGMAMGVVAFCPWLLLKFVPLVQSPAGEMWANGAGDSPDMSESPGSTNVSEHSQEMVTKANQRAELPAPTMQSSTSRGGGIDTQSPKDAGGALPGGPGGSDGSGGAEAPGEVLGAGSSNSGTGRRGGGMSGRGTDTSTDSASTSFDPASAGRGADTSTDRGPADKLGKNPLGGPAATPVDAPADPSAEPTADGGSDAGGFSGAVGSAGASASAASGGAAAVLLAAQAAKRRTDSARDASFQAGGHATEFDPETSTPDDQRIADDYGRGE